jgi:photosystem II stability/assembly factor-like uncharacterized protein
MKRFAWAIVLASCIVLIAAGVSSASFWTKTFSSDDESGEFLKVSAVDEDTLYIAASSYGYGTSVLFPETKQFVFKSTDGGLTVEPVYELDWSICADMIYVQDVFFENTNTGYLVGTYTEGASLFNCIGNMRSYLAKTVDGGLTWAELPMDPVAPEGLFYKEFMGIEFSGTTGYAVGDSEYMYKSEDGGANWAQVANAASPFTYSDINDVAFAGDTDVWVAGFDADDDDDTWDEKVEYFESATEGQMFKTVDSGASWMLEASNPDYGIMNVFFLDADNGWFTVAGFNQTAIPYTNDGGATWANGVLPDDPGGLGTPGTSYVMVDVAMGSLERGFAVGYNFYTGQSVILNTFDGGANWSFDDYADTGELYALEMVDHRHGFAVGGHHTVVAYFNTDNEPPVADAGTDRSVDPGDVVTLDGSASMDPDGDDFVFNWAQVGGPTVSLDDSTAEMPTFTTTGDDAKYTFQLTVTDELAATSAPDEVEISAGNPPDEDDDDDTGDDDDTSADDDDEDDDEEDDDEGCCG